MADKLRLMLLISGGGTTALEIIHACNGGRLKKVEPVCVVCSKEKAPGIERAQSEGIPTTLAIPKLFGSPDEFGDHLLGICREYRPDLIGQYGWLPKTPPNLIKAYAGRMTNQHPGPLDPGYPDFGGKGMYGKCVHAARLYFVRATKHDFWTEATAQLVNPEFDRGTVLHRQVVKITPGDDPIDLQQRVLPIEHRVQIETLELIAEGQITQLTRSERLIHPDEEATLTEAKRAAGFLFPHG